MKFSIITVTYNCVSTIRRTIESVLCQSYKDYEYIIIDGFSNDGTKEIIEEYKDCLAYYISEPDEGIYYAMNKGIERAKGEYLYFLNGDDYFIDNTVLSRVKEQINGDRNILIGKIIYGNKESLINCFDDAKSKYYDVSYPHQATFIPRRLFEDIGRYNVEYSLAADYEWICRAIYKGSAIRWIDERISHYSTIGRSTAMWFIIEQYMISFKYMKLTEDAHLQDMTELTIERAKNKVFETMFRDPLYIDCFRKTICSFNKGQLDEIALWGAGFWAELYLDMLKECGISVKHIIDKRGKGIVGDKAVVPYRRGDLCKILISTESYDKEVANFMGKEGLVEGINYLSFHKLRDILISEMGYANTDLQQFEKQTGLYLI